MGVWPFSMFEPKSNQTPVLEKESQAPKPVLLKAEKEAEKIYKREVWWLEHRTGLKKSAIVALIVVEAILGLIGLYAFADYYLIDYVEEQRMASTFFEGAGDLKAANTRQTPIELSFESASSVQSGQRYDILAFVENPNTDWIAQLEYHFNYAGEKSSTETIVVNQQSRLALTKLGIEGARSHAVELVIDDVMWQKIDLHKISDPILWKKERWNLEISEAQHSSNLVIGDRSFGRTTFKIRNKTGFGYYEVPITVVLKRGNSLVGVNKTTISNLIGLEESVIQVDWFDNAPSASIVEVYPALDLFDDANYMPKTAGEDLHRIDTRTIRQ